MWMKELFGVEKPIIAMCHMQPMPGDPAYDADGGMEKVLECARKDLLALQEGGVDGVMFSNEFSLPYLTKVETVTVASMAAVIGELKSEIQIPYGVNCLWDPVASIDLAVAVGGKFIREIITGVYASDFGLWNTNVGATVRHKMAVSGKDIKMLYNIVPEAATYLGGREIESIAKTTEFNNHPDALCVSGLTAGSETDTQILMRVKNAVKHTPVLCNTGCNKDNIRRQLQYSDGAVCATTFKVDGVFENPVDVNRVKEFMAEVKDFRSSL
ncbi:MAG: BtpA/SgcQ family protein [Lachnospiraceae bacterium]|nr:BtpA/SgcQ family protein [Lachnospiraceae bacterium]